MCDHSPNSAACAFRYSTWLQKAQCNESAASTSDSRSVIGDTRHGASRVGAPTSPVDALHRGNSFSAVVAGETTWETIGAVLNGNNTRRLLQIKYLSSAGYEDARTA
jgi:hypothetical protein